MELNSAHTDSSDRLYDAVAPAYEVISDARRQYLTSIDSLVGQFLETTIPNGWLDVGTGDGRRLARLRSTFLRQSGQTRISAVEPSSAMRKQAKRSLPGIQLFESIESIPVTETFSLVTMLWNVVGHLDAETWMSRLQQHLSPGGRIIFDVNMRYNAKQYGLWRCVCNVAYDFCHGSGKSPRSYPLALGGAEGIVQMQTSASIKQILKSANLTSERIWFLDYSTGQTVRSQFSGQALVTAVSRT